MPEISVIVPNYNHAGYLKQRMQSILTQTFQDYEIILLDDCSTDNSTAVMEEYRNHSRVTHIVYNAENSGSPFRQWEKGISLAKGKYIWIAESDDVADDTLLSKAINFIKRDPNIALVYVQSKDIDEHGLLLGTRSNWTEGLTPDIWHDDFIADGNEFIANYLIHKNVIPNSSAVLFARDMFCSRHDHRVLELRMLGDWYTWISLIMDNKIGFIAQPLNSFRTHHATTRNHGTEKLKKQRILEQMTVHLKAQQCKRVSSRQWSQLRRSILLRWANRFTITEPFLNPEFYLPVRLGMSSKVALLESFLYCSLANILKPRA